MNRRAFLSAATFASLAPLGAFGAGEIAESISYLEKEYVNNLSVSPAEGRFLSMLVRLSKSKEALEIGTSRGYTTLWLAEALQSTGGKLTTIDILKERTEEARDYVEKSKLTQQVTFHSGNAHELVSTLKKQFDFVLLDADKKGNLDYFQKLHPALLAPSAVIMAHGAKTMQKEMTPFMEAVTKDKNFDSVTLTIVPEESFFMALRK